MDKMYSFNEIGIIPANISSIEHRGDINVYRDGKLPIFVSPMTCILNTDNFDIFNNSRVIPILPVTADRLHTLELTQDWQALTLQDFAYFFNGGIAVKDFDYHILIDCANGHMKALYDAVKDAKEEYPNIEVMVGNIANPETYLECCKSGVDYVRVGIGGGSGCTTSVQTGIHTSLPWLLDKIDNLKSLTKFRTKVIADGGVNSIDKAIKALALGADYVMMGKCFAECKEACGKIIETDTWNGVETELREYYGQSSEKGQMDRFGIVKSNPEGCDSFAAVKGSLKEFEDKFTAALRSAMSYCNAATLEDFIGKVEYSIISLDEFRSYMKW